MRPAQPAPVLRRAAGATMFSSFASHEGCMFSAVGVESRECLSGVTRSRASWAGAAGAGAAAGEEEPLAPRAGPAAAPGAGTGPGPGACARPEVRPASRAGSGPAPARTLAAASGREGRPNREAALGLTGVRLGGDAGEEMMSSHAMTSVGGSPGSPGPAGPVAPVGAASRGVGGAARKAGDGEGGETGGGDEGGEYEGGDEVGAARPTGGVRGTGRGRNDDPPRG